VIPPLLSSRPKERNNHNKKAHKRSREPCSHLKNFHAFPRRWHIDKLMIAGLAKTLKGEYKATEVQSMGLKKGEFENGWVLWEINLNVCISCKEFLF